MIRKFFTIALTLALALPLGAQEPASSLSENPQTPAAKTLPAELPASFVRSLPADSLPVFVPDTVPEEIPPFKRKLESTVFIPKGQWAMGVSVSYSQTTQNDYTFSFWSI